MVDAAAAPEQETNLAGVEPVHVDEDDEHESAVEDVQVDLVGEERAVHALDVLDETEDASDEDEGAGDVEQDQVSQPADLGVEGAVGGTLLEAGVEDGRDDDEEAEEEELDDETKDDNVLALFGVFDGSTSTCILMLADVLKWLFPQSNKKTYRWSGQQGTEYHQRRKSW